MVMASTCIDDCLIINDHVRVRPTYANLHKWPEAEAEFIRSISRGSATAADAAVAVSLHPKAVDSISSRQMFLRSYTFTRNDDRGDNDGSDDVADGGNDHKCFGGRPKKKKTTAVAVVKGSVPGSRRLALGNGKTTSRRAVRTKMVRKWMFCATTAKVDVDQSS